MKKTITETIDNYRLFWSVGPKIGRVQMYDVDVYRGETLIMEWSYPRIKGCGGLLGHVAFWRDQAVLEATVEEREAREKIA